MQKKVSNVKQRFFDNFEKYCQQSLSDTLKKVQELKVERQKTQHQLKYVFAFLVIPVILCGYFAVLFYDGTLDVEAASKGFMATYFVPLLVAALTFGLFMKVVQLYSKMHELYMKMNHLFVDLIISYFKNFEDLREQGGFIVYRSLEQSELFGKKIKFDSEDCFVANVDTKRVLVTEANVNLKDYLIMVLEVENKFFRPTMAPREGGIFKFSCNEQKIDVSFGENKSYMPITSVSYEDIAQTPKLFYVPFWVVFEELKQSVLGASVEMAFFEDKLVLALREDTNLFEPVKFDMQMPAVQKLSEIAWQIQSIIKFADFYDEQRDVLLKFAQENKFDYKEITSHRFA